MSESILLKETVEAGPYLFVFDGRKVMITNKEGAGTIVLEPDHVGTANRLALALRRASARMDAVANDMKRKTQG